ncbi:diphosphate--fructose-6-phosphate 1-phosphotransferase [candidate division KSB1 bacterium]|nr:diphosphate--fructose-6-phosphate 1-phosphotransferase [candidate division KSB1 bacterium]
MPANKNVIIAQSGGPSPVINNTLRGIIETCQMYPDTFSTLYASVSGIEGLLQEHLLNLSLQPEEEIKLLRTTPASGAIGTCRYRLKNDQKKDFQRLIDVFQAHQVGYFFYIGGNDSMTTALKIDQLTKERNIDLVVVGAAKTINNDMGDSEFKLIDHTPGYGSVARYWSYVVQNADQENRGMRGSDPVLVLQVMGRRIGFLPAAARLADPKREMPLQIYMPESGFSLEEITDNVNDELNRRGRCLVVVSEGLDVGDVGQAKDSFGRTIFGSSSLTAEQIIVNHLNRSGIKAKGLARGQVAGTDQRDTMIYASTVDLDEAYKLGQNCVLIALEQGTGSMSTILRRPGVIYNVDYTHVPLALVANSEREFPRSWITPNRIDVTDDFYRYARPLIGEDWPSVPTINGLQRFSRLEPKMAEKKLPAYFPQAWAN